MKAFFFAELNLIMSTMNMVQLICFICLTYTCIIHNTAAGNSYSVTFQP